MKREKIIFTLFALLLVFLAGIVGKICIIDGDLYAKSAASQRISEEEFAKCRAIICDRNMIPLVSGRTQSKKLGNGYFEVAKRYDELSLARHVIGYTDKYGQGAAGIEKTFDSILTLDDMSSILKSKDAMGNNIDYIAESVKNINYTGDNMLMLTIDYHIQKAVESALDSANITGAAVIIEIPSFDIVAMASRGNFVQYNVENHLKSGNSELINRATAPYNAGSIFKIITSAAGIECGAINQQSPFYCAGKKKYGGIIFSCLKKEGHGAVDLKNAFSLSCNTAFYDTGVYIGGEMIKKYAEKFGLGKCVLTGEIYEDSGNLPDNVYFTAAESANLAIGQGEVLITPLQAAKMTAVIANGGIAKQVNIADAYITKDGNIIADFKNVKTERVIESTTANEIADMMAYTVEYGTGYSAKSNKIKIAGKTGSAETGWEANGETMVQAWFTGFFPTDNPKYAMAIVAENGKRGGEACAPIFKEIAEKIV